MGRQARLGPVSALASGPPGAESRARAFYGGLLGLPEVTKPESLGDRGVGWFRCGDQQLHCGVEAGRTPGRHHPGLLTDELDALRSRLSAAGVRTYEDRQIPGYRRFYAEDPFGNRLEFLERARRP